MTAEGSIAFSLVEDTFLDGRLYRFDSQSSYGNLKIGIMEWLVTVFYIEDKTPHFTHCLAKAWRVVTHAVPSAKFWLVYGDPGWRPNNRIARYKRLLKNPQVKALCASNTEEPFEILLETQDGIKYSIAVPVTFDKLGELTWFFDISKSSFLVASASQLDWTELLNRGVPSPRDWDNCHELVAPIVDSGGVIFRRFGFFDDTNVGVQALASSALVRLIRGNERDPYES
ncbi:hypothetical protein [Cupriavidus agavae]|uniref:Uncharacterized protein n=1 Tax=Cupriavidus agavae TaxID=1001822 RepID=A0A4Q7S041_9BURK|nr:hypothetical protein [Cupriavidus agavae]RZT38362.1 hypothetical protein EV147_2827 [Cupriavidus agavae]